MELIGKERTVERREIESPLEDAPSCPVSLPEMEEPLDFADVMDDVLDHILRYIEEHAPTIPIEPGSEVEAAAARLGLDTTAIDYRTYLSLVMARYKNLESVQWA
jgi:hypothetical protein